MEYPLAIYYYTTLYVYTSVNTESQYVKFSQLKGGNFIQYVLSDEQTKHYPTRDPSLHEPHACTDLEKSNVRAHRLEVTQCWVTVLAGFLTVCLRLLNLLL